MEAHQNPGRDMQAELGRIYSALMSVTQSIFLPQTTESKARMKGETALMDMAKTG